MINPVDSFQICYPDSGIFIPFIEVYNVCGADTDSVRRQITAPIQPQVSLDTTAGCVPFTVNAFNTSTQPFGNPLNYLWTIDGQVSSSAWTISNINTAQPSFQFLTPGNYDVCVTLLGDCDTVTLCETVNASGAPSISLQPSIDTICVTGCVDYVWTLNNTNAGINVSFFDGVLFTSNPNDSITICYPTPGAYEIFVADSNVCGVDTERANIVVNDSITTDIIPDTTAGCVPFDVSFANNSSVLQGQIDSIRWSVNGNPNDYSFVGGTSTQ